MTAVVLRKELHNIIDNVPPARSLPAIKPLLMYLVEQIIADAAADDYWKPVIEPASTEEIEMIEERMKDYETDPSTFVPLESIK